MDLQEFHDRFYFERGPCCAGCDRWRSISGLIGECHARAPVSGHERYSAILGNPSPMPMPAGHILTYRDHHCGDFKDEFDWEALPLPYRLRVGEPKARALRTTGE